MTDGRFTNYYQDCILCITLELHLLFNFFSQFFMLHPHPCLVELIQKSCDNCNIISGIHFVVCTYYIFYNYTLYNNMNVNCNLHNIVITYFLILKIPTNQCTGRILTTKIILENVFLLLDLPHISPGAFIWYTCMHVYVYWC